MRIAVLADTHIPKRARTLPDAAWKIVRKCDAIIHAGDVLSRDFLKQLEAVAPLYAVRGNNDLDLDELPETLEFTFDGANVAMIHDSGDKKSRAARLKRRFPNADIVVFGHSHVPMNELVDGQLLFNPGSPTDRRLQPHFTMGVLTIKGGKVSGEIVVIDG